MIIDEFIKNLGALRPKNFIVDKGRRVLTINGIDFSFESVSNLIEYGGHDFAAATVFKTVSKETSKRMRKEHGKKVEPILKLFEKFNI